MRAIASTTSLVRRAPSDTQRCWGSVEGEDPSESRVDLSHRGRGEHPASFFEVVLVDELELVHHRSARQWGVRFGELNDRG